MLYPEPKYMKFTDNKLTGIKFVLDRDLSKFEEVLKRDDTGSVKIMVKKLPLYEFYNECTDAPKIDSDEAYAIKVTNNKIFIYSLADRGTYYAILYLNEMQKRNEVYEGYIFDWPDMKIRGIIEGFYGKPWEWNDRIDAVRLISKYKMNTYIYAPKDDPFHRSKWAEPYDVIYINKIKELYNVCNENYIDFYYSISPGLSIEYSSQEHFEKMQGKLLQIFNLGVRNFCILYDDIFDELVNENDLKKYKTLEDAHVDLTNRLYCWLKSIDNKCTLTVCPTVYCGFGDEEYVRNLCRGIPPDVNIFWTGREICSHSIHESDAKYFYEMTGHKPLYWDNYPVNDMSMANEMHIRPIKNRSNTLYKYSSGFVSNVMEYKESSMIPVISVCHYLWNSKNYNEKSSMEIAVKETIKNKYYSDFMEYTAFCCKSCLESGNSDYFRNMNLLNYALSKGKGLKNVNELEVYFKNNLMHAGNIKFIDNKKLLNENKKWIKKWILFNKFNLEVVYAVKKHIKKTHISIFLKLYILYLYEKLKKNPVEMMNIETDVLFNTIKS